MKVEGKRGKIVIRLTENKKLPGVESLINRLLRTVLSSIGGDTISIVSHCSSVTVSLVGLTNNGGLLLCVVKTALETNNLTFLCWRGGGAAMTVFSQLS